MTNNILAILIVLAAFVGMSSRAGRGLTIAMLGVIGSILLFVSLTAAQASNFGPLMGVGAFVGTIALFFLFRRK